MMLAIRSLTKAYGGLKVVDDLTFTVPARDLVGVIGPNGAGKSTMFSLVTGFLDADAGDVRLGDADVTSLSPVARAKAGMVRTFQVPKEFGHLTVRENMLAAAPSQSGERLLPLLFRPGRVREEEARLGAKVDALIAFLKLDHVARIPAGRLSGGQKKLLELGRALMTGAGLILLDEPFAGVHPVLIGEISQRIRELNADGVGFLIIEHDLGALTRLVSTLHVMDRGRLIASGDPPDVLRDERVREAYLGGAA